MAKTEMKKAMFPREFVEFIVSDCWVDTVTKMYGIIGNHEIKKYTLDELYEHWLFNVKNKEK